MRRRAALPLVLLVAPVLGGCLTLFPDDDGPVRVTGPVLGYQPTPSFLKVQVREGERIVLVDFDRRDWHVSELARRIDERRVKALDVEAEPRELLNEVLVRAIHDPDDLGALHYGAMGATAEERDAKDAEYEALLRALPPPEAALAPAGPSPPALPPLSA